jgi:hypothetical protein
MTFGMELFKTRTIYRYLQLYITTPFSSLLLIAVVHCALLVMYRLCCKLNRSHLRDIYLHLKCVPRRRRLISPACSSTRFRLARAHRRPVGAAATRPRGCIASACLLTIRFCIASGGTASRVAALSVTGTHAMHSTIDQIYLGALLVPLRVAGDWPARVAGAPPRVAGGPPRVAGD